MRYLITLLLIILCIVTTTWGDADECKDILSYDDFKINLVEDRRGTFESQVRQSLTTTKNFFERPEGQHTLTLLKIGVGSVPYIGSYVAPLLPMLGTALAVESDWKEPFAKTIADETRQAIAEYSIPTIEATIKTVTQNVQYLAQMNDTDSKQRDSLVAIVHIINNALDEIANTFLHNSVIFRKYPLVAVKPLFALASFVAVYSPVEAAVVPTFANISLVSCKFYDTLLEYRDLVAEARVKEVKFDCSGYEGLCAAQGFAVTTQRYQPNGYSHYLSGHINRDRCDRPTCNAIYCLTDELNPAGYRRIYNYNMESVYNYLALVRLRVERKFTDAIDLVNRTCIDAIRVRPRNPTGFGWWTVVIKEASYPHNSCDMGGLGNCDPYVKIYIDGEKVFKTTTKKDATYLARFYETYSSNKIHKNSAIRIEVWDEDLFNNERMFRWNTTISELLLNGNFLQIAGMHKKSELSTFSKWRDEFIES